MGFWEDVKKGAQEPERVKHEQEMSRYGNPVMLLKQSDSAEFRPKRLLVFEDRVELHDPGFFKTEMKTMRYSQIAQVRVRGRVLRADISIESSGGDSINVSKVPKSEAEKAAQVIHAFMAERESGSRAAPAVHTAPDLTDQIKKLAELKDAGILSDEEFQEKKSEILKRI